ncbi:hypothetical protein [Planktothricoides raciborskii]|uniref:Uncharacterized protein n=1 Tax=Planktothricoides raciborskii GIHE-MW2 TaxID=2792601 RepID=A0AAU8JC97_9CYAN
MLIYLPLKHTRFNINWQRFSHDFPLPKSDRTCVSYMRSPLKANSALL